MDASARLADVPRDRNLPPALVTTWRSTGSNCEMNATTSSRPENQHRNGGMGKVASSTSTASIASTLRVSQT